MDAADVLQTLPIIAWHGPFDPALRHQALTALEHGKVLVLPDLPFPVAPDEADLLRPDVSGAERKNVSLDPRTGWLGNTALPPGEAARLTAMVRRFADQSARLLADLLPRYAPALEQARTSFRPNEIAEVLFFALRFNRRKRTHDADAMMARITAERLVERLERSTYLVMHKTSLDQNGTPGNCSPDQAASCICAKLATKARAASSSGPVTTNGAHPNASHIRAE